MSKSGVDGGRCGLQVRNSAAQLTLDLAGGSVASFTLAESDRINPLSWDSAIHDGKDASSTAPRPLGHFLCLDRWGPPTEAEEANGMGYHGEASSVRWEVLEETGQQTGTMHASLPLCGLHVKREVRLLGSSAFAMVREHVTNKNLLGRIYNMVQHPSIAPPFLDESTLVDCNAIRGFAQGPNRTLSETPDKPGFCFPNTINRAGAEADARHMTGGDDDVQSYEVSPDDSYGWICATNAAQGLVFGYVWPRDDYPWISLWCCSRDGVPCARGLEFGTTGYHQPFPILMRHPQLLGLPTLAFLDAGETRTRSYATFLVHVPNDWRGNQKLVLADGGLTLIEHETSREVKMELGEAKPFEN